MILALSSEAENDLEQIADAAAARVLSGVSKGVIRAKNTGGRCEREDQFVTLIIRGMGGRTRVAPPASTGCARSRRISN
jgi:hypothetical protein